jgi:hypothetical protein
LLGWGSRGQGRQVWFGPGRGTVRRLMAFLRLELEVDRASLPDPEPGLWPGRVAQAGFVWAWSAQGRRRREERSPAARGLWDELPSAPEYSSDRLTVLLGGLL